MKTWQQTTRYFLLALAGCIFICSSESASAQTNSTRVRQVSQRSFLDTPAFTNSPEARALVSAILETQPSGSSVPLLVESAERRMVGTYWSLQKSNQPPWPTRIFYELPTYEVSANHFVVDDRAVNYAAVHALRMAQAETNGGPAMIFESALFDYSSTTNLWLEIPTNGVASNLVHLIIHNTSEGLPYTLLTKSDLAIPSWVPELIVTGAVGNATSTLLSQNDRTNLFIWAHTGLPSSFMTIVSQPLDQEVLEGDMVTFSVVVSATGGGSLTYQWMRDGLPIPGATSRSYTMDAVWFTDEANYAVIISNGDFSIASRPAILNVLNGTDRPFYTRVFGPRQDYQFKRGHTYYVGMAMECYGTTIIESGSVIKFDSYYSDASVRIKGDLICNTDPNFPAILTSVDDDSAGAVELWSSHEPFSFTNGWPYLDLSAANSGSVSNLHFRFADRAISVPENSKRLDIWHSQFYACYSAVENYAGAGAGVGFHNVLLAGCGTAVLGWTNSYSIEAEHLTAYLGDFWYANIPPARISLTNSIVQSPFAGAGIVHTQNTFINTTGTVFQPTTYGRFYLPDHSPWHHAGTTNVSPSLLAALRAKTTYAPLELPSGIKLTGDIAFFPRVPRYTNGTPDIGYHYQAIDYILADLRLKNGTLTVHPGTALAAANLPGPSGGWIFNGVRAENGAHLISRGTPAAPNIFTTTKLVQEVPPTEYAAMQTQTFFPFGIIWLACFHNLNEEDAIVPRLEFEFSKFFLPYEDYQIWGGYQNGKPSISYESLVDWSLKDCELHGGQVFLGGSHPFFFGGTDYVGTGSVTWRNTLFDVVNVMIEPSKYYYFGVVDCDMSFVAENNLFRGGAWFSLRPLPATAGNWTLKDNLFDLVHFIRPTTNAPLVMDYNGYWAVQPADMLWGNEVLLPLVNGGGHEITFDNVPQYEAGPYGKYYLPMGNPLYHLGSRPFEESGLSQYTTRVDQFTEGQELAGHAVNIGLHYVAAQSNQLSTTFYQRPRDTDGDGVPDYVEDKNGNNAVDANETSRTLAQTGSGINDATNSVYDDIDLSGNGLVGRIKKALGQNPLNPKNPFTLKPVVTGDEPITFTFEVPVSYDAVTAAGFFHLNMDGFGATGEQLVRATNGDCLLVFNQYFDPPGSHLLSANFQMGDQVADGSIHLFFSSNELQFESAGAMFDDNSAYLDAKVFADQVDYVINLYDTSNTNETYIASITNTTNNRLIQEDWGLTNANGTPFTGASVRAEFVLAAVGGGSGGSPIVTTNKPSKPLQRATNSLSEWGLNFNFAYMYTPSNGTPATAFDRGGAVWNGLQGVVDYLIAPRFGWDHYNSDFNRFVPPIGSDYPGYLTSRAMVTNNLYPTLVGAKQFFCYAHGNSNSMGNAVGDTYIKAKEIGGILQNSRSNNVIIANNPYRFVFLDGCSTASGLDWQTAFGIADKTEFTRNKTGAQAYVGWAKPVADWLGGNSDPSQSLRLSKAYTKTLQQFYLQWMNGTPLAECIDLASLSLTDTVPLPVPENANCLIIFSDGTTYQVKGGFVARIIIAGHPGLTVNGVNSQADARTDYSRR